MKMKALPGYEFRRLDKSAYRILPEGADADIGDISKLGPKRWRVWPAVEGRPRPKFAVTVHDSLRRAAAHIVKNHERAQPDES